MINPEEIFRQMSGQQMQQPEPVSTDKLDEFINRACEKADFNLHMLGQDIAFKFSQGYRGIMSFEEADIYPQVLNRINERLQKGEQ